MIRRSSTISALMTATAFTAVFIFAGGFVLGVLAERKAREQAFAYAQCNEREAKFVSVETGAVLCFPMRGSVH